MIISSDSYNKRLCSSFFEFIPMCLFFLADYRNLYIVNVKSDCKLKPNQSVNTVKYDCF